MKKIIVVCLVLVSLIGCAPASYPTSSPPWVKDPSSPSQMSLIKNYQTCGADTECHQGEVCSFVAPDTFAVCVPGNHHPF
jgi:hypothetical protein